MKAKRTLVFKYSHDNMSDDSAKLRELLTQGGFPFVLFDCGMYFLFKVQRASGKTWGDTMDVINSIKAPLYKYENTIISDGVEVIDCGIICN